MVDRLGAERVTVVVRGSPTINDATMDDARRSGLVGRYEVIDNGSDTPGTHLPDCTPEVVERLQQLPRFLVDVVFPVWTVTSKKLVDAVCEAYLPRCI